VKVSVKKTKSNYIEPADFERFKSRLLLRTHINFVIDEIRRGATTGNAGLGAFEKTYSEQWAKHKIKSGRPLFMSDSGDMLRSISAKESSGGWVIGFDSARAAMLARIHNEGLGEQPVRRWFGLNSKVLYYLNNIVKQRLNRFLKSGGKTG
jgi:hypothetical protein